ncbi:P-loop NTPase fold protein [Beijerinckia sp. L45]|uniref:P-loop NTPase fold protein n=1 Tax=Beijerinckia sp. L45 TaxID=1641855 RepID=UPI00131C3B37|nr:P-loop NTPase fold protein [Beijerinckia sp. L45]
MKSFLADPTPEVLCIEGRWGTGKTYAWEEAVRAALASDGVAIKSYAYVSLFGLKDASDIIQSIYANTQNLDALGKGRTLPKRLGGFKFSEIRQKLKAFSAFAADHASVPHVASLGGVARALLANFVTDTIVCIDDFERRGRDVTINEVMGTIAQLRDARNCKVVLILNDNSLGAEEKAEFLRYSEKVIDRSFQFSPSAAESAAIAFPGQDELSRELRTACERLGIVNIRVMAKIDRYARDIGRVIGDIDPTVVKDVTRSLVVIVWSMVSPQGEGSPSLTYLLEKRGGLFVPADRTKSSPEEDGWNLLLTDYGFTSCDEFDLVMIEDVKNGYFNEGKIKAGADKYLRDVEYARARLAFEQAWKPFHASFDDDVDEVAASIFTGCTDNVAYLTPMNLGSAVGVLKDIGYADLAETLLRRFMAARGDEDIFDMEGDVFGSEIRDPDVRRAFDEKLKDRKPRLPTPIEAATRIYKGSWSQKDEECLARYSTAEFVSLFKDGKGPDRSVLIFGCLEFRKVGNATPRQREIARRAEDALIRIGAESPLNAHRLKMYNVAVPEQAPGSDASGADVD